MFDAEFSPAHGEFAGCFDGETRNSGTYDVDVVEFDLGVVGGESDAAVGVGVRLIGVFFFEFVVEVAEEGISCDDDFDFVPLICDEGRAGIFFDGGAARSLPDFAVVSADANEPIVERSGSPLNVSVAEFLNAHEDAGVVDGREGANFDGEVVIFPARVVDGVGEEAIASHFRLADGAVLDLPKAEAFLPVWGDLFSVEGFGECGRFRGEEEKHSDRRGLKFSDAHQGALFSLAFRRGEEMADLTGFEPAIFCVTGRCVKPGYTTGPPRTHRVSGTGFEPVTYGL